MKSLHIEHSSIYEYSQEVLDAQHLAYLHPADNSWQSVVQHQLIVEPEPAIQTGIDAFGNRRSYFAIRHPHRRLEVHAHSVLTKKPRYDGLVLTQTPSWESVRDRMQYSLEQPFDPACEFVWPSPYIEWSADLKRYAMASFGSGRPIGQACSELCQRIFDDFTYESGATEIHTPIEQAFMLKKGVCQDFAHIMIGCLRTLGLAARYMSGYLLTTPPPGQARLRGADASHAWVSVYCPTAPGNWIEFDPTNNSIADLSHVCLAVGRDFGDVSPVRGVINGGGAHTIEIAVTVEEVQVT
jgi:transglutaminase-like putative cysteine protease